MEKIDSKETETYNKLIKEKYKNYHMKVEYIRCSTKHLKNREIKPKHLTKAQIAKFKKEFLK